MKYNLFIQAMKNIARKSGTEIHGIYSDGNQYKARFMDGTMMVGSPSSRKIAVLSGRRERGGWNHVYQFEIDQRGRVMNAVL